LAQLAKLIYLDVILRTSCFPALVGLSIALWTNVGVNEWKTWVAFIACLVGMFTIQGMYEHALDYLRDKGGYSAFRQDIEKPSVAKKALKYSFVIASILALIIILCERWWLILFGIAAFKTAKLYVVRHSEAYAVFGFMLSYRVGYFSATNYPTLPWLIGLLLIGFLYKAALPMYRLDDYLAGELPSNEAIIQYYRNIMRYLLHTVPLLIIILVFSMRLTYPVEKIIPWAITLWILGFGALGYNIMRYKAKAVMQEAPIWAVALAVMGSDILSATISGNTVLFLKMLAAYAVWWLIFTQFWRSRHALCNLINCPMNPLAYMGKERPK